MRGKWADRADSRILDDGGGDEGPDGFKDEKGKPCHPGMSKTQEMRLLKGGFGLNDAPRLWRLRLD